MVGLNRILLLFAFALYWGGLTFYTGFVVRISHDVLADPMDGGLITQRVTAWLQILGVVTVILMLWNNVHVLRQSPKYGYALIGCTAVLTCALAGLFFVHSQLDAVINVASGEIVDRQAFTAGHQTYNQLTTVQWLSLVTYLPIVVLAWRTMDRRETRDMKAD